VIGYWRTRSLAAALALALGACSALGLDDFDLVRCEPGSPCEELNRDLPDDQCERYYCSESGYGCEPLRKDDDGDRHADAELCEPRPGEKLDCDDGNEKRFEGNAETCDGIDNNCDEFIDEAGDLHASEIDSVMLDGSTDGLAAHAPRTGDDIYLLLTQQAARGEFVTQRTQADSDGLGPIEALSAEACNSKESCNLAQLALAGTDRALLAASIHRGSCAAGQLRIGVSSTDAVDLAFGQFGVDVDPDRGCTRAGASCGASDPAIAALAPDGAPPQALVAWLAPAPDDGCENACACAAESFAVIGLGLQVRGHGMAQPTIAPFGDARPVQFAELARGAPALAAVSIDAEDAGYVLAYPSRDRIEFLYVPQFVDGRQRAAVAGGIEATEPDHVAIAVGRTSGTQTELIAAFREGARAIRVAPISLAPNGDAPFAAVEPRVSIAVDGTLSAGPFVRYAAEGFASEDSGKPRGGYLILWVEHLDGADRLRAQRVAESGFRLLGPAHELVRDESIDYPFAYTRHGGEHRFVYVTSESLHLSRITCDADN
jgi:hypothetical protein